MKKTTRKTFYTSPEVELLVVRCAGGILTVSDLNAERPNSVSSGYDDSNDLGTI